MDSVSVSAFPVSTQSLNYALISQAVNIDICDEITDARTCGVVHCAILQVESMPLAELAPKFGLAFAVSIDRLISKVQAEAIAKRILHCDLAYSSEIMTEIAANALASRFLECFTEEDSQYYTNGDYYSTAPRSGWMPATAATFDTGIIVIGKSRTGCLWVEDED